MPQNVKIETFSLHPDSDIEQRASQARKALKESLQVIANHEKCLGVFWMRKDDNPSHIVAISSSLPDALKVRADRSIGWGEEVQEVDFTSRTEPLKSHILSETLPTLCIEDGLEKITSYSICSLFTCYFPATIVTDDLKSKAQTRAKQFVEAISPLIGQPMNPKSLTSAWSSKNVHIDGEDMKPFLLCTTWLDQESQIHFRLNNESWKDFLEDMKALGSTLQHDSSGKLRQVYGRQVKYVFLDSDYEEEEEEMFDLDIELLNLSGAAARMREMAEKIAREFGSRSLNDFRDPESGSDEPVVIDRGRLRRIE